MAMNPDPSVATGTSSISYVGEQQQAIAPQQAINQGQQYAQVSTASAQPGQQPIQQTAQQSPAINPYPGQSTNAHANAYANPGNFQQQQYDYAAYQNPSQVNYAGAAAQGYDGQIYPVSEKDQTLRMIAFIFAIISTVSVSWTIIALAWMIPMTVHCYGIYKGKKPNTTAFGVCTLLFLSLVGGILLLCSTKEE